MSNGRNAVNAAVMRCPVCEGHGILPHGFYDYPAGTVFGSNSTAPERCRQCEGKGIIPIPTNTRRETP